MGDRDRPESGGPAAPSGDASQRGDAAAASIDLSRQDGPRFLPEGPRLRRRNARMARWAVIRRNRLLAGGPADGAAGSVHGYAGPAGLGDSALLSAPVRDRPSLMLRQWQWYWLAGQSNAAMAAALGMASSTVRDHVSA